MKCIFFDTEFTSFERPRLISIGMIAEGGAEFYCEFTDTWSESDCSEFVLDTVLPELEGGAAAMTAVECAGRLVAWIEGLDEDVQLACDSPLYDQPLVEALFNKYGWPSRLSREIAWIDVDDFRFYTAMNTVWESHPDAIRHHALWDARVLMMAAQLKDKLAFLA